jgi:hypothetical protein
MWMLVRGPLPADWTLIGRYLPLDFQPQLHADAVTVASLLMLLILVIMRRQPKTPGRGMISWVAGITLCWGLVSSLWLDWIDTAKSYRSVFTSMQAAMPREYRCIASTGLGESERAMLHYILGINTKRHEITPDADCDLLLIEELAAMPPRDLDSRLWTPVWEGTRPSDQHEHFWLFKAVGPAQSMRECYGRQSGKTEQGRGDAQVTCGRTR